MPDKILVEFIIEARKRGFSEISIKEAILDKGWPIGRMESAFKYLNPKFEVKNQVCVFLSDEIISKLEKRSKENMMTLGEQVEDILRRSCTRNKSKPLKDNIDDLLLSCFSRKKR